MAVNPAPIASFTSLLVSSFFQAVPYIKGGFPTERVNILTGPSNFISMNLKAIDMCEVELEDDESVMA
jgi:hypothetical protein